MKIHRKIEQRIVNHPVGVVRMFKDRLSSAKVNIELHCDFYIVNLDLHMSAPHLNSLPPSPAKWGQTSEAADTKMKLSIAEPRQQNYSVRFKSLEGICEKYSRITVS